MSTYKSDILLYSSDMELGDTLRVICPRCNGGSNKENSLTITYSDSGVVWNCFRASCNEKGTTNSDPTNLCVNKTLTPVPKQVRRFEGTTVPLSEQVLEKINKLWGITEPPYWYWTPDLGGRIAMSIRSPKYMHRGWVMRSINPNARQKALTYVDEGEEGISWYRNHLNAPTVVVEDMPSAVRAMRYVNAVALCGTGVSINRAKEISKYAVGTIYMALDQDATDQSFKIVNKWSLLWGDVKVLPLQKDMKDTSEDELCQILSQLR